MKRLRQNQFTFLIAPGIFMLGAGLFLLDARGNWNAAKARFTQAATELNRLERLTPYPNEDNLRQVRIDATDYETAVVRMKEELRGCIFPLSKLAPNEFQSRLREAGARIAERAKASAVRLPNRFYLGFDKFASALPNETAAPLLGQELIQIEWLLNLLIDAGVESMISFRREPLPEESGTTAVMLNSVSVLSRSGVTTPIPSSRVLERNVVEATFISTPEAASKILNQIGGASRPFFIVRLLRIRNEQDTGPARDKGVKAAQSGVASTSVEGLESKPTASGTLHFIVGQERIETSLAIEMVRFTF